MSDRGVGGAPEEEALLDRMARGVVERGLEVPAVLFLESFKPMTYLGSQFLVFIGPVVQSLWDLKEYALMTTLLERRDNVELLIQRIERLAEEGKRPRPPRRGWRLPWRRGAPPP